MSALVVALAVLMTARLTGAQTTEGLAGLVGGRSVYTVHDGDTLSTISARVAVSRATLIEMNRLTPPYTLSPGQSLVIDNTHIAIGHPELLLTINVAQRLLVFAEDDGIRAYPITVGRPASPTPLGGFTITDKAGDPALGPLEAPWIGLSVPGVGIYGTNAPSSIYSFSSHGCIRMHPEDVADLFERVSEGMPGVLIYEPVIVAIIEGRIWIEAHPDVYRRGPDALRLVQGAMDHEGAASMINWAMVETVLRQRRGRAVDVTRAP